MSKGFPVEIEVDKSRVTDGAFTSITEEEEELQSIPEEPEIELMEMERELSEERPDELGDMVVSLGDMILESDGDAPVSSDAPVWSDALAPYPEYPELAVFRSRPLNRAIPEDMFREPVPRILDLSRVSDEYGGFTSVIDEYEPCWDCEEETEGELMELDLDDLGDMEMETDSSVVLDRGLIGWASWRVWGLVGKFGTF